MIWQEWVKTSEEEALELYIIIKYDSPYGLSWALI